MSATMQNSWKSEISKTAPSIFEETNMNNKKALTNILLIRCPHCNELITVLGKYENGVITLNYVEGKDEGKQT